MMGRTRSALGRLSVALIALCTIGLVGSVAAASGANTVDRSIGLEVAVVDGSSGLCDETCARIWDDDGTLIGYGCLDGAGDNKGCSATSSRCDEFTCVLVRDGNGGTISSGSCLEA